MRIVMRGNFQPDLPEHINGGVPWSTEAHIAGSWEQCGHEVIRVQEDRDDWATTLRACDGADLFLWVSTWGFAHSWPQNEAWAAVKELNERLPTVAMHLDLFAGLARADQIAQEPWMHLGYCFTADGGHPDEFTAAGVNHRFMPPAIYEPEASPGRRRPEFASDVAFVGNWRGGYHEESAHRPALVEWLRRSFGGRCRFWPKGPQIRGRDLADLYASARVVVGDSCLSGTGLQRYSSDRIPETLGRRGLLVHPHTGGVTDGTLYTAGEHLACWDAYDWDRLRVVVGDLLDDREGCERIREAGWQHVRNHHTYAHRVRQVVDTLVADGALPVSVVA